MIANVNAKRRRSAGYRDVVRNGVDGLLVPPGRPAALADALRALAEDRARRERMAAAARERATEFSWPTVADRVMEAYEDARAVPEPSGRLARAAARTGVLAAAPDAAATTAGSPPAGCASRRMASNAHSSSIAT